MPKEVNYPHPIGAKISDEQKRKIDNSGMSTTDFVRNAIDFYDGARLHSYTALKMNVIDECIHSLNIFKQSVKNSDENAFNLLKESVKSVKQNEGNLLNKTDDLLNESEEYVKQIESVKQNSLNESEESVKQMELEEETKKQQEAWEQVKTTLRNMTTAKGRPSHEDFRRQAKKCGKSKAELERYYQKHIKFFQQDCV